MKKVLSLLLCLLVLSVTYSPATQAAQMPPVVAPQDYSPQFTHISIIVPNFSIGSLGRAVCAGIGRLYTSSQTVEVTVALQRLDGDTWKEVKSWTESAPGIPGVNMERIHYVTSGTYRVCVTVKAYSASGTLLETASAYSYTVKY